MSMGGQCTKWSRNIAENFNHRLSRAHERYRRQTDGRAMTYSEREREFTFAKNEKWIRRRRHFVSDSFLVDAQSRGSPVRRQTARH